jgi:Mg2+-importing ATPase
MKKLCPFVPVPLCAYLFLNSHFLTGLKNVLDRAVLQHKELNEELSVPEYEKVDELPFVFSRKLMSVIVETPQGNRRLICKGAPDAIFERCTQFELDGQIYPMDLVLWSIPSNRKKKFPVEKKS